MISDGAAEAIKEDNAMSVFFMDFDMAPSVIWARDLYDQMQIQRLGNSCSLCRNEDR